MDYEDENLKIKIFLKDKDKVGKLLANANVAIRTLNLGFITIKGFQIWPSPKFNERLQAAVNITPPSKQAYGRFYPQVFFEEPKLWFELEEKIYSFYLQAKISNTEEKVSIEDLPI